jgi:hypothetical protein
MKLPADKSNAVSTRFLSSLLGDGCDCHYNIEIVGHSLRTFVAALLGVRVSYFIFNLQGK